jgi:hypoxanthine phosphoribosyltransferase
MTGAPRLPADGSSTQAATPPFAHASEAELARILDFYEVRWEYEPHTFPILWNLDGAVVESFSPDFYLPDLDLYVELTTLKQTLVRKKNRKLRRLRELYPNVRIKLFYARDFRALMLKFGKVTLVDELSGTSGQMVPDRLEAPAAMAAALVAADVPPATPEPVPPAPETLAEHAATDPDRIADDEARRAARRQARRRRRRRSIAAHLAASSTPR